jgi:hypothetical protein
VVWGPGCFTYVLPKIPAEPPDCKPRFISGDEMSLTASQRVTLITGITPELDRNPYFQIVAILQQFGVETQTEFSFDNGRAYILEMIENCPDETLLALGEHFRVFVTSKPAAPTPSFMLAQRGRNKFKMIWKYIPAG